MRFVRIASLWVLVVTRCLLAAKLRIPKSLCPACLEEFGQKLKSTLMLQVQVDKLVLASVRHILKRHRVSRLAVALSLVAAFLLPD